MNPALLVSLIGLGSCVSVLIGYGIWEFRHWNEVSQ